MTGKFLVPLFWLPAAILLPSCSSTPSTTVSSGLFQWPVSKARLTQPFRYNSKKKHNGIDLAAKKNTPIYSIAPGKVIYAGQSFRGFGKMVLIEHKGRQWASLYAHLNRFKVREGDRVNSGDLVGLMGRTGNASGNHLHFELRFQKRPVDPLKVLPRGAIR